jgi:hypothetical protein
MDAQMGDARNRNARAYRVEAADSANSELLFEGPPSGFTLFDGRLYFSGARLGPNSEGQELWRVDRPLQGWWSGIARKHVSLDDDSRIIDGPPLVATVFQDTAPGSASGRVRSIEEHDGRLWFKARSPAPLCAGDALWSTDGTLSGTASTTAATQGQSTGDESQLSSTSPAGPARPEGPTPNVNVTKLWGVLGLAALPHLVLSIALFRRLPARLSGPLVFNLLGGVAAVCVVLFMAITQHFTDFDGFGDFLKAFFTLYSILVLTGCIVLVAQRRIGTLQLDYAVSLAAITLYSSLHAVTGIPAEDAWWRYALFNLGIVFLILMTVLTSRTVPMLCAGVGVCFTVWRITAFITDIVGDDSSIGVGMLRFAITAGMGVLAVILGAYYSKRQPEIERRVDSKRSGVRGKVEGDDEGGVGATEHVEDRAPARVVAVPVSDATRRNEQL